MRPDPKAFLAAAIMAALATGAAHAANTRTEYRYPDRPNTVYTSDGQVLTRNDDRPIAFSNFEAAISARDAQKILNDSSYATETPVRLPEPRVETPVRSVFEQMDPAPYVAPKVSVRRDFTIQAGAFGSYENASRLKARLEAFGPVTIAEGWKNGAVIYRVQLGGFASKPAAAPTLQMIKANGFDGYVVSAS